jgi:hypothetical protein
MPVLVSRYFPIGVVLLVQRVEFHFVVAQQSLISSQAVQQLTLRETFPPRTRLGGRDAADILLLAICTWERAIATDLPLLT